MDYCIPLYETALKMKDFERNENLPFRIYELGHLLHKFIIKDAINVHKGWFYRPCASVNVTSFIVHEDPMVDRSSGMEPAIE